MFHNKLALQNFFPYEILVRACSIGLAESITMLRLSHHTIGGLDKGNFNSERTDDIHVCSATNVQGFYILLRPYIDTMCCCFDCHDTRLEFVQKSDVDLRSSGSDA